MMSHAEPRALWDGRRGCKEEGAAPCPGWKRAWVGVGGPGPALLPPRSADSLPQCGQMWSLALWPCSPGTP